MANLERLVYIPVGIMLICLCVVDSYTTKLVLAAGGLEANPLAVFNADPVGKGVLAAVIAAALLIFKPKLLGYLVLVMCLVVIWNLGVLSRQVIG